MTCPQCRTRLPAQFALAIRAMTFRCPQCRVDLRATRESLAGTATAVTQPCMRAGITVGSIGALVSAFTHRGWICAIAVAATFLGSVFWSWRVALRHVRFELA
jgi:hypothetical protein